LDPKINNVGPHALWRLGEIDKNDLASFAVDGLGELLDQNLETVNAQAGS
jgi:hypothetical protein